MAKYITGFTTEEWDMIFSNDPTPLMDDTKTINLEDIPGIDVFSHPFLKSDKIKTLTERNSNRYSFDQYGLAYSSIENLNLENLLEVKGYFLSASTNLKSLSLPNLKSLGAYFLNECTSLTSISMPSITSFDVDFNLSNFTSLTEVNFPNLSVGKYIHFKNCTSLTEINLPSLTTVDNLYFDDCTSLNKANLPNFITGRLYFSGCTSLTEISLPLAIGPVSFSGCTSLTKINLPSITTVSMYYSFGNCPNLSHIYLPSLKTLGDVSSEAITPIFAGSPLITSISADNFPVLETMANGVFRESSLQEFSAPPLLLNIPKNCFYEVTTLTTVNLNNVTNLEGTCFKGCSGLTTIDAPNLKTMTSRPFEGCVKLKNINMPELEGIVSEAFRGCDLSGEIDLSSVKTVGGYAFAGCKFTELTLPEAETFTSSFHFQNCKNLEKLVLPKVIDLGYRPFDSMGSPAPLKELYLLGPQVVTCTSGLGAGGIASDCKIFVPENLVDEYKASSIWSSYSDKIFAYEGEL